MLEIKPTLVGITGGIGSGKSIICKIFQALQVPVYDADSKARWLMEHEPFLIKQIIEEFGKESYVNGVLQRQYIGSLVFSNPAKLQILNSITHPAVEDDFKKWVIVNKEFSYLIKEAALFIEAGSYKLLDKILLVSAPVEIRISRVLQRDGHRTEADIRNVIDRQLPDEEKRKFADFEILNDGINSVLSFVLELDAKFKNLHNSALII